MLHIYFGEVVSEQQKDDFFFNEVHFELDWEGRRMDKIYTEHTDLKLIHQREIYVKNKKAFQISYVCPFCFLSTCNMKAMTAFKT